MKYTCLIIFCLSFGLSYTQDHLKYIDFSKLNLQFEDASAELKPEYLPLVYRLADTLRKTPDMFVTIRGHVCCVNKNKLAKKRAKMVRYYLLHFGVSKDQIATIGMRNSMPIASPEKTREDELANMRVDFIITRKQ